MGCKFNQCKSEYVATTGFQAPADGPRYLTSGCACDLDAAS
jgi:hypothetical protein